MSIKKTINNYDEFKQEFIRMNRADDFSTYGIEYLFDYYDSIEDDIELDVIAICCDWLEIDPEHAKESYGITNKKELENYLNENTFYVKLENDNYLIQK